MYKYIFILFTFSFAAIINIPDDYSTIQEGISVAEEGDTVLIADGTYFENLILDKDIILASAYIIDFDLNHRDNTIINGSAYSMDDSSPYGSCIVVIPPASNPQIIGLTLTGGKGTRMYKNEDTNLKFRAGGGILFKDTYPHIEFNSFINNGSYTDNNGNINMIEEGGGVVGTDDGIDEVIITQNSFSRDDTLIFRNNIFLNNEAMYANSMMIRDYSNPIDLRYGYFDVYNCNTQTVPASWIYSESASIDASLGSGENCVNLSAFVYISPDGEDCPVCGTINFPYKTIQYAIENTNPTEDNIITLQLTEGTYSPTSTGENFPIILLDNMKLTGIDENSTYLNPQDTDRAILVLNCINSEISNLAVINGNVDSGGYPDNCGGGIYIGYSDIILNNVKITSCNASWGGGLYINDYSTPYCNNLTIINNDASADGGGLMMHNAGVAEWDTDNWTIIENSIIQNNDADGAGGGVQVRDAKVEFNDVILNGNSAYSWSGGAINLTSNAFVKINKGLIINNAVGYGQGNVSIEGNNNEKELIIINSTIANNSGSNYVHGAGLYVGNGNGTALVLNSIIYYNDIQNISSSSGGNIEVFYTNSTISSGQNGNINSNPMFINSNSNFQLQENSPCIDIGTDYFYWNDSLILDLSNDEYYGANPDLGYYEYIPELEINIISPNGNEILSNNELYNITWNTSLGIDFINISLYKNNLLVLDIIDELPNNGSFSWLIPNNLILDSDYLIKISDFNNEDVYDISDDFFTITSSIILDFGSITYDHQSGEGNVELLINTSNEIDGYQFQLVDNPDCINIISINGGVTEENDFITSSSLDGVVLSFSMSENSILPGEHLLTNILFEDNYSCNIENMSICLTAPIFSDQLGYPLPIIVGDCIVISDNLMGDINLDEIVNILDIVIMVEIVLEENYLLIADLNNDQIINILDIVVLIQIILNN